VKDTAQGTWFTARMRPNPRTKAGFTHTPTSTTTPLLGCAFQQQQKKITRYYERLEEKTQMGETEQALELHQI
jgi:hypothetical protein